MSSDIYFDDSELFTTPAKSTANFVIQQAMRCYEHDTDIQFYECMYTAYKMPLVEMKKLYELWTTDKKIQKVLDHVFGLKYNREARLCIFVKCWKHLDAEQQNYIIQNVDVRDIMSELNDDGFLLDGIDCNTPEKAMAFFAAIRPFYNKY